MEELYLLFRLIAFCLKSPLVGRLGDEPFSGRDEHMFAEHDVCASIEELARYIRYDDHNGYRKDAFVVLYAEMMRRTKRDISPDVPGRTLHPYPAARKFLTIAAGELEEANNPWEALQAIRQAVDTQRKMRQRVDDDGCGIDCGFASALHREYMREDAR